MSRRSRQNCSHIALCCLVLAALGALYLQLSITNAAHPNSSPADILAEVLTGTARRRPLADPTTPVIISTTAPRPLPRGADTKGVLQSKPAPLPAAPSKPGPATGKPAIASPPPPPAAKYHPRRAEKVVDVVGSGPLGSQLVDKPVYSLDEDDSVAKQEEDNKEDGDNVVENGEAATAGNEDPEAVEVELELLHQNKKCDARLFYSQPGVDPKDGPAWPKIVKTRAEGGVKEGYTPESCYKTCVEYAAKHGKTCAGITHGPLTLKCIGCSDVSKSLVDQNQQNIYVPVTDSLELAAAEEALEAAKPLKRGVVRLGPLPDDGAEDVHVCFCSDDPDLRPLAVAISSAMSNTKTPSRLVFHLITRPDVAQDFASRLHEQLPNARLEIHFDSELQGNIQKRISFRKTSGARKTLSTPFNFAPFYLDAFLSSSGDTKLHKRLIYVDTDVVLLGDVTTLHDMSLEGHAVAAVEDCSQTFDIYVDFKELRSQVKDPIVKELNPKACVFNRGIFIMDVPKWKQLGITPEIETWMARYKNAKKGSDLYKFGMSQPPWLLAVRSRYKRLGVEWNCRGLGREWSDQKEFVQLTKVGISRTDLTRAGVKFVAKGWSRPYVAPCSGTAMLLHYNGAMKPWKKNSWEPTQLPSLCQLTPGKILKKRGVVRKKIGTKQFVQCLNLWSEYLTDEAESSLVPAKAESSVKAVSD